MAKASVSRERRKSAISQKYDTWQGRAAGFLVILLMCVQPLFLSSETYFNLTRQKFLFFAAVTAITLLFVMIIWAARLARKPSLMPSDRLYLADWAILGFALVTLVSAIFSPFRDIVNTWIGIPEPEGRYDGAITQLLYVAVFFIVSRWYVPRERHFIFFGISSILIALIGILQFYGMDFLRLWPVNHIDTVSNTMPYYVENFYNIWFRTTLGNVDMVSSYVCVAVLLCGFLFVKMKSNWKYLWLAGSALNFWMMEIAGADSGRVGVAVTVVLAIPFVLDSRKTIGRTLILIASWIVTYTLQMLFYDVLVTGAAIGTLLPFALTAAVLLVFGALLVLCGRKSAGKRSEAEKPRWKTGIILIAAVIALGAAGVEAAGRQESAGIVYELREIMHGRVQDEFGTRRVYIWRNALEAYPEHPIIGTGPDTFEAAFPEEAQAKYGENYDKAHNEYIQILVCQGLLGLIFYLVFLVSASVKAVPKALSNPLAAAVLLAFAGYCVQAFFNISLPIASQLLWVFAGMLANSRFRDKGIV